MALKLGNLNLERISLGNLYNAYLGMNSREQTMALVATAVVLILLVALPVAVASSRISKLERSVEHGRRQLKDVMRAIESYDKRKAELAGFQRMLAGGYDESISSTLESIAEKVGMKDRIDALKERATAPSDIFDETTVDVKMRRVRLPQLIEYLYVIEHEPDRVLRLNMLNITPRFDNKQELNVTFSVSTYRLQEGVEEGL